MDIIAEMISDDADHRTYIRQATFEEGKITSTAKFKFHVTVCACRYLAGLGYYIPHLRTKKDTVLREKNIACIARGMTRFLPLYLDGGEKS